MAEHAGAVRSLTLARGRITEVSRELLWSMVWHGGTTDLLARAELVSYIDAVEIEVYRARTLSCRWRFVRDAAARVHGERIRRQLEQHGYCRCCHQPYDEDW